MPSLVLRTAAGDRVLHGTTGETVMRVIQKSGEPAFGDCGGSLACATCHVVVHPDWAALLPPPSEDEEAMLDTAFALTPTSRLGCQIPFTDALDGLTVSLP